MLPYGLRVSERIFLLFFAYIAVLSFFFHDRPHLHFQPFIYLLAAAAFFFLLSKLQTIAPRIIIATARDWLPLAYTLIAFREMELFAPSHYDLRFEPGWIKLDIWFLGDLHAREILESLGLAGPFYLEFSYLLVYGLAVYSMFWIAIKANRPAIDRFWAVYLVGTLTAYGLFPFFPSLPPRYAFPMVYPPNIITPVRTFNLWILHGATIHTGVFPSAHVSSAFSAAWALYSIFPQRRWLGHGMIFYALSVSLATVYGRYHYIADVLAGFVVSLVAAALCLMLPIIMKTDVPQH